MIRRFLASIFLLSACVYGAKYTETVKVTDSKGGKFSCAYTITYTESAGPNKKKSSVVCKPNKNGGNVDTVISIPGYGDVQVKHAIKKNKKTISSVAKVETTETTPAPPSEGESFNKTCSCKMDMSKMIKEVEDWENEWGSGPMVSGRKAASNRGGPLFFLLFVLPQLTSIITNIQNLLTSLGIGRSLPVNNRIDDLAEKLQTANDRFNGALTETLVQNRGGTSSIFQTAIQTAIQNFINGILTSLGLPTITFPAAGRSLSPESRQFPGLLGNLGGATGGGLLGGLTGGAAGGNAGGLLGGLTGGAAGGDAGGLLGGLTGGAAGGNGGADLLGSLLGGGAAGGNGADLLGSLLGGGATGGQDPVSALTQAIIQQQIESMLSEMNLESLLGAALGNGGLEELMAGAGLNGGLDDIMSTIEGEINGGLGEMLGGMGMSDEEWAALEAEWDAEWEAMKADPWMALPKLHCSCTMGFD